MSSTRPGRRIELAAARLAIEWEELFAAELRRAAQQQAKDSELITLDNYLRALPVAVSRLLHVAKSQSAESTDVQQRVA